jgi:hypothetical protein
MTFLLHTWLQALSHKSARVARTRRGANRHRPHRTVPRLEVLEDRLVPSQNGVTIQQFAKSTVSPWQHPRIDVGLKLLLSKVPCRAQIAHPILLAFAVAATSVAAPNNSRALGSC